MFRQNGLMWCVNVNLKHSFPNFVIERINVSLMRKEMSLNYFNEAEFHASLLVS
jgi:hypothetical protein